MTLTKAPDRAVLPATIYGERGERRSALGLRIHVGDRKSKKPDFDMAGEAAELPVRHEAHGSKPAGVLLLVMAVGDPAPAVVLFVFLEGLPPAARWLVSGSVAVGAAVMQWYGGQRKVVLLLPGTALWYKAAEATKWVRGGGGGSSPKGQRPEEGFSNTSPGSASTRDIPKPYALSLDICLVRT